MAVYFPNRTRSSIPATFDEAMTTNSNMIYDLTAKAEEEYSLEKPIVVPYTSEIPWKRTLWKNSSDMYDTTSMNTSVGVVGVYCVNALVCPPTVAQEVTFLLSVQAGDDYEVALPQIQIQGGFATPVAPNIDADLVSLLGTTYGELLYPVSGVTGTTPEITEQQILTVIRQGSGPTEWIKCAGESINLSDGTYTSTLQVDWLNGGNTQLFASGPYQFELKVLDGLVSSVTSDSLTLIADTTGNIPNTVSFSEASRMYLDKKTPVSRFSTKNRAQSDTGASEPIISDETLANSHGVSDISKSTTGEYCKSLRPLTKRFVRTRKLDPSSAISLTPATFNCYDSTTPTLPIGTRAWGVSSGGGGLLPESWLNLVSYIYRFYSGSVRTKVFIPFTCQATTSLDVSDDIYTTFDSPAQDPAFVSNGVINNAVETHLPYYGQVRARTIGDNVQGAAIKIRYEFSGAPSPLDLYEAAGDDANMWFIVGPPIMRPSDVIPTAIPVIKPTA